MYHRFHAPDDGRVTTVCHVPGDTWNVNPPALARVPRLYCRNERVIIPIALARRRQVAGAGAGRRDPGRQRAPALRATGAAPAAGRTRRVRCDASFRRGEELGYFHHGSTIIVLAPPGLEPVPGVVEGARLRVGQPLLRHAPHQAPDGGGVASSSSHAPAT